MLRRVLAGKFLKNQERSLAKELAQARVYDEMSPPVRFGSHEYYVKSNGVQARRPLVAPSVEEIVINPMEEQASISCATISNDGRWVAYLKDVVGDEHHTLVVKEISSGSHVDVPRVPGVVKSIEWDASGRFLFCSASRQDGYSRSEALRPSVVWLVDLREQRVKEVAREKDAAFMLDVRCSRDRSHVIIGRHSLRGSSEQWVVPSDDPLHAPTLLWPLRDGISYTADRMSSDWVIFCHQQHSIHLAKPLDAWRPLFRAPIASSITDIDLFSQNVVAYGYNNARPVLWHIPINNSASQMIHLPGCSVSPTPNPDVESSECRFVVSSPLAPPISARFQFQSASVEFAASRDWGNIETVYTESGVPITLCRPKKSIQSDSVLISVYGAYGAVTAPSYDAFFQPLASRGWTLAFAHVRGGGMLGHDWHDAGRGKNRIVASQDLNECASFLRHSFNFKNVCVRASSAGGFTAVAAAQLPEADGLYQKLVLDMPFVNVVDELSDVTHPLSSFERDEWGPLDMLKSIDPLENVQRVKHQLPAMHVLCSPQDIRVPESGIRRYVDAVKKFHPHVVVELSSVDGGHYGGEMDEASQLSFLL